jgi:transposase
METNPPPTSMAPTADTEDAHKIGHKSARNQRIEVITRGERRRVWTLEQKREIVAESFGPELTPTEVVRKYGISSGQLYTWRQKVLSGPMARLSQSAPRFAQVEMPPAPRRMDAPDTDREVASVTSASVVPLRQDGLIEILLADGVTLRVDAHVDSQALRRIIAALVSR